MTKRKFRGFCPNASGFESIFINGECIFGEWVEGYYTCFNGVEHRIYSGYAETDCGDYYPDYSTVIPETVREFTGMLDKKRREIWEHNECVVTSAYGGAWAKGYIKFVQGCFVFIEYGTRNLLRLCDLALNNYEIKVVNDFYNTALAAKKSDELMSE